MGSFRPTQPVAKIRHIGVPDFVVVGRAQGGEDRNSAIAQTIPNLDNTKTVCHRLPYCAIAHGRFQADVAIRTYKSGVIGNSI